MEYPLLEQGISRQELMRSPGWEEKYKAATKNKRIKVKELNKEMGISI